MALKCRFASKFTLLVVLFLLALWIIGSSGPYPPFKLPVASAATPYGIQGQMAPELNLPNWIDGSGRPIEPISLGDYRGKVVYLYFFQDW